MKYEIAEAKVVEWGRQNQPLVNEIYVIGSRGGKQVSKGKKHESDLDLMIFIDASQVPTDYYESLSEIGFQSGLLIHPLFILKKDRESKLRIKEYADALELGRKIF